MPAKTKKQERFMQAVANNKDFAKKVGVPQSVGKEFTKVKKYENGGNVTTPKKEKQRIKDMAKEARMKKILTEDMKTFGPKEESKPKKPLPEGNPGLRKLPKEVRGNMGYKKNGGMIKKMKAGGMVKKCCDGIAKRGKTKGRMV